MSPVNKQIKFLDTLFDPFERVCQSADVFGTQLGAGYATTIDNFISINPLQHSRKDANVTVFRNILLEFDIGSRENQLEALEGVPVSTITFSGGKSLHAIISLAAPCADAAEYKALVKRIYALLPTVDKANSNPSRFTRMPEVARAFNDGCLINQESIMLGSRVSRAELEAWLGPAQPPKVETHVETDRPAPNGINKWTKYFIAFGAEPGTWNSSLFKAACDLARNGVKRGEAVTIFENITGHLDTADIKTIASAYRTVQSE